MNLDGLKQEWLYQQQAYDNYERSALHIKFFSFTALFILFYLKQSMITGLGVLATIWLAEGIWKTFQSRIDARLMTIEKAINNKTDIEAFQFNTEFSANRGSTASLIMEYLKQSLKPTVAYSHAAVIAIYVFTHLGVY